MVSHCNAASIYSPYVNCYFSIINPNYRRTVALQLIFPPSSVLQVTSTTLTLSVFCLFKVQPPSIATFNYFLQDNHAMPLSLITIKRMGRISVREWEWEKLYPTLICSSAMTCLKKEEWINGDSKQCSCVRIQYKETQLHNWDTSLLWCFDCEMMLDGATWSFCLIRVS